MVETSLVAEVMGGDETLGSHLSSLTELANAIAAGLPKQALRKTVQRVFEKPAEASSLMYRVVPEATYKRRTLLTPSESERTERLARVIAMAEYVWDDTELAQQWLKKPHPELGGQTPIECAMTELGARQVEQVLAMFFYGIPP
jgi:putative toxin-antitoxin system antitoxin component (TIGR02293 family)